MERVRVTWGKEVRGTDGTDAGEGGKLDDKGRWGRVGKVGNEKRGVAAGGTEEGGGRIVDRGSKTRERNSTAVTVAFGARGATT
jgi:hypothetical protein